MSTKRIPNTPYIVALLSVLFILLTGCDIGAVTNTNATTDISIGGPIGSGVQGVKIFVEPEAGEHTITSAITGAQKSVWVEMYLLTDRSVIRALQEAAHRKLDVRVMLEMHPFGGGASPQRTLDLLKAAGVQAQPTSPSFALTHEKGMIIDGSIAYIMTSNFTRSALGGSSGGKYGTSNREYDIVDSNAQDVQDIIAIFSADWNHTPAQFNNLNLVVSPTNSRNAFTTLIGSARSTLLIAAEEIVDSGIEQALVSAAKRGVHVQVLLPAAKDPTRDSNAQGINAIRQNGIQIKEDPRLYMHAKIIVVDGRKAFVGSENISTQSLDKNRELGILVADSGVLNTLQQTFQKDWAESRGV